MNKNIATIFFLILILASVFSIPTISSITTTTADGTYKAGEIIPIKVTFSEDVNVNSAILTMNTNATAAYIGVTGAILDFNYTVGANQNTTDLEVSSLTGSIISAIDGNAADLNLNNNFSGKNIQIDTNAPICSITSPTTDFNSTSGQIFQFSCSGETSKIATINGIEVSDGNTLTWLTANTTYTALVDANDTVGNTATQASFTFKFDTTAPTSITFTAPRYTNDSTPDLNFGTSESPTTGWKLMLSCNTNGPWKENIYSSLITNFDITSSTYGCDLSNGENGTIYARFVDKAGNWSNAINDEIGYDTTNPKEPTNFEASVGNREVELTWNEPSSDNLSGNDIIEIYMNNSLKETIDADETSTTIDRLTNGSEYKFKIRTRDRAGNYSNFTNILTIIPQATITTITLTPNVQYVKNNDKLTIECLYSEEADNAILSYKYTNPTTSKEELEEDDGVDSLETVFTVNDNLKHERIYFYCEANGSNGAETSVRIDNNKPFVEWKDTNNAFTGTKKVLIKATDNLNLAKLELDFNNTTRTLTQKDSNGNYYFDLNTMLYENGSYALKAIATDGAGNKTEITRTINLDNYVSPKQLAEKAINEAKVKQKTALDLVNYYKSQGLVVPNDLNEKRGNAITLINSAQNDLNSNPQKARTDATEASKLFDEFNSNATIQVKESKTYVADTNSAIEILQKYGFSAEEANNQLTTMQNSNITRKLVIVQSGTSTNRQVRIELSFTNDTNSNIVKIVEVIPKELIDSASKIVSDANFRIIKDDPVIEFTVDAPKGSTTTISYGIGEITSIQAQELIDKNVITLYETAPILLEGDLTTENTLKNLAQGNDFLLIIIGLLIVLVIIGIVALFVKFKAPGHGFGGEKTLVEHVTVKEKEAPKKKFEAFKK